MGFYKDSASSEMSRLHDLSAQQGRRIADLEAEIERLREGLERIRDDAENVYEAQRWADLALEGGE